MAKKQTTKRSAKSMGTNEVEGNVDKIRDILFGSQMRDFEQRLDAMEKRLTQAVERGARDLERRVERLDKYTRREVDKLSEQLKVERKDRVTEARQGANEFNNLVEQVEAWFAEVDEQLARESKDLRGTLNEQGKELTAQIREAHNQLLASLQKETSELANVTLAKEDMAAVLTEVAMRLNKDLKQPKG